MIIPFNKPLVLGDEIAKIGNAAGYFHLSGNGIYTKKCQQFLENRYSFRKCLLTTSCTDALEMASILLRIKPGDEVIVPSFTYVSTALAFNREGAKIIFADSRADHPGIDEEKIENLITSKTKAIVVVHYAGVACDMDKIITLAEKYHLPIVEDAAHSIDSFYKGTPLGGIGQIGCFSFHETKNIHCGEGGMITLNNPDFTKRSEIVREKGTNRTSFENGESNFYEWVDKGSSFMPSELNAAFLFAQIENIDKVQKKRISMWDFYYTNLKELENKDLIQLPVIPDYATNNANLFYLVCRNVIERNSLIKHLLNNNIQAVFHYRCLHKSQYIRNNFNDRPEVLINAEMYQDRLLRLPLYFSLTKEEQEIIVDAIIEFYNIY